MMSRFDDGRESIKPSVTPMTTASLCDDETNGLAEELQRTQSVVTELIALFQDYRMSVEARMTNFIADVDARIERLLDERLADMNIPKSQFSTVKSLERKPSNYNNPASASVDLTRLREEVRHLTEDHSRLTEKVKRINELNCESHIKSSLALKTIRDLIKS
jgi:hypothetical protein